MRNVTVEYLQQVKSGSYQYRRRIPKILQGRVKEREFIKVLGKTQKEALLRYGSYHEHVEHLISLTAFRDRPLLATPTGSVVARIGVVSVKLRSLL